MDIKEFVSLINKENKAHGGYSSCKLDEFRFCQSSGNSAFKVGKKISQHFKLFKCETACFTCPLNQKGEEAFSSYLNRALILNDVDIFASITKQIENFICPGCCDGCKFKNNHTCQFRELKIRCSDDGDCTTFAKRYINGIANILKSTSN